jgi:hypothetical protein
MVMGLVSAIGSVAATYFVIKQVQKTTDQANQP